MLATRFSRNFVRFTPRMFGTAAPDLRPQFLIGEENGFLPRKDPVVHLPKEFAPVEALLEEMPWTKKDGTPGLLQLYKFGEASKSVPDLTHAVKNIEDTGVLNALFRDYTFWASSYLLEPCHHNMLKAGDTSTFGMGRDTLPVNISGPLIAIADKIGAKPFMEYAQSYALFNWKRKDPKGPLKFDNLELIRSFTGGKSEIGFILVHVTMVAMTNGVVSGALQALDGARNEDREGFNAGLKKYQQTLNDINREMDTMWQRSNPAEYVDFRTFIMGIKDQPMFPNGVFYEDHDPATGKVIKRGPWQFRGESGANDNIIPTSDNLLQLTDKMPSNPLTEILQDFRTYRPLQHNKWLTYINNYAKEVHVRDFAFKDNVSKLRYLGILDEIRDFRNRHWNFTKEYIIKRTLHPVATGGSPIVTWLPNQLSATLKAMEDVAKLIDVSKLSPEDRKYYDSIKPRMDGQVNVLDREVAKLKQQYPNA